MDRYVGGGAGGPVGRWGRWGRWAGGLVVVPWCRLDDGGAMQTLALVVPGPIHVHLYAGGPRYKSL